VAWERWHALLAKWRGHSRPDGRIGCWSRCRAGGGQPRRANDCIGRRGHYWNGGASNGARHRRPSDAAARGVSGEHGWHSGVGTLLSRGLAAAAIAGGYLGARR